MKAFKLVILFPLLFVVLAGYSQNNRKLYRIGKKSFNDGNYKIAKKFFTQSIEADSSLLKVFLIRAEASEKIETFEDAVSDYKQAILMDKKEESHYFNAGRLLLALEKYQESIFYLKKTTELDEKYIQAYQLKVNAFMKLEMYEEAIVEAEEALMLEKNALNYYNHGLVSYYLKDFKVAEADFNYAITFNENYIEAYIELAKSLLQQNRYEDALNNCNIVIELNPLTKDIYIVRSEIYHQIADYEKAINDVTTVLTKFSPNDKNLYFKRGKLYQEFNEHKSAINDFCKVISLDKDFCLAYYQRAISYEETLKWAKAVRDYNKFVDISTDNIQISPRKISFAKTKIYELNREANKPEIVIFTPKPNRNGQIEVPLNLDKVIVKGKISDESDIEYLKINGIAYKFSANALNNEFEVELNLQANKSISIITSDIYMNTSVRNFQILSTEIDNPQIHLINPYASDNGEIYLDESNSTVLFIEGKITDESRIKSILIDGTTASYKLDELNPQFTSKVEIGNKKFIEITVEDIYGNKTMSKFTLNREGANLFADNPMGKTWVIFIENSKYRTFASLEGPSQDISLMKSAFSNYRIHKIIHKKNMTKAEMGKFFSIELRDLVKKNRVNSLLVWYAGHGKFIHETGYWIAVDSKRDDEFSYFNINNLKASLHSYSKYVTHTLVITDACESGPSFYMGMRSEPEMKNCGDWEATKFKSSQVFTSAGKELATDKSQFTKTFSNSLKYNPNDCIPIDNIVIKVSKAVSGTGNQKPKFGKIAGMEDENGTFFFIKKE